MENSPSDVPNTAHKLTFHGTGSEYFGVQIVNLLLTVLTVGLYYPWARAARLKYVYHNTELQGSRFTFHGTGREMFIGLLKVVLIISLPYSILLYGAFNHDIGFLIGSYLLLMVVGYLLVPTAIHGALRYRLSRSSWRGIHFGYRGQLAKLFEVYIVGVLLSSLTLYLYYPYYIHKVREYIIGNIRMGNVNFRYTGDAAELFRLMVGGFFLTLLTGGIYYFRFQADMRNYLLRHIHIQQPDGQSMPLHAGFSGTEVFRNWAINGLILVFTLGFGAPYVVVRNVNFMLNYLSLPAGFDANQISQTEADYTNALGDDLGSFLSIDLA